MFIVPNQFSLQIQFLFYKYLFFVHFILKNRSLNEFTIDLYIRGFYFCDTLNPNKKTLRPFICLTKEMNDDKDKKMVIMVALKI